MYVSGTKFHYTTHGWTLLSAAIEGVSGMPFLKYLQTYILSPVGMDVTGPDKNNPLLYNRSRLVTVAYWDVRFYMHQMRKCIWVTYHVNAGIS